MIFEYFKRELNAQTKKDDFEYRLTEKTIIYGVFKENILLYAIELKNAKIVQALGKFNKNIEPEPRKKIDRWLREVYLDNGIYK